MRVGVREGETDLDKDLLFVNDLEMEGVRVGVLDLLTGDVETDGVRLRVTLLVPEVVDVIVGVSEMVGVTVGVSEMVGVTVGVSDMVGVADGFKLGAHVGAAASPAH